MPVSTQPFALDVQEYNHPPSTEYESRKQPRFSRFPRTPSFAVLSAHPAHPANPYSRIDPAPKAVTVYF